MSEIVRVRCEDRTGEHEYSVRMLRELGQSFPGFDEEKIAEIWKEVSQHEVLFSDYTAGQFRPFFIILMDPRGVWMEVVRLTDSKPIGPMYITDIIPRYDALGHFTFWDSVASGREPIVWATMNWIFSRYDLHRMSVAIPPFQSGLIRFVRKLGFIEEGEKRESIIHKGVWKSQKLFGILRTEAEEKWQQLQSQSPQAPLVLESQPS